MTPPADLTSEDTLSLVQRCASGDEAAYNQLFQAIYQDLRRRAHVQLSGRRDGTMSTTLLVHETYLKLAGTRLSLNDRAHFFAISARAMRQIAINAARDRAAQKRRALARAARQDARAEEASTLPRISAGIDAGKYGLSDRDYDVRGRLILNHSISGGKIARVDQAGARAVAAEARASRVRSEAEREAAIAWSDVRALEQQLAALESSYVASRQSRDVLAERFRVARGTLFDLLESESGYFNVAATYIRAITELDAARYVLLSRTGQLLPTLNIDPPALERR